MYFIWQVICDKDEVFSRRESTIKHYLLQIHWVSIYTVDASRGVAIAWGCVKLGNQRD